MEIKKRIQVHSMKNSEITYDVVAQVTYKLGEKIGCNFGFGTHLNWGDVEKQVKKINPKELVDRTSFIYLD